MRMKQMTQELISGCNFSVSRTGMARFSLPFNLNLKKMHNMQPRTTINISYILKKRKNERKEILEHETLIAPFVPP